MTKQEALVLWTAAMQSREFEAMIRLLSADQPITEPGSHKPKAALLREMAEALDPSRVATTATDH